MYVVSPGINVVKLYISGLHFGKSCSKRTWYRLSTFTVTYITQKVMM